jgi:hypothetical protein
MFNRIRLGELSNLGISHSSCPRVSICNVFISRALAARELTPAVTNDFLLQAASAVRYRGALALLARRADYTHELATTRKRIRPTFIRHGQVYPIIYRPVKGIAIAR